jgi:hypothetical protein
VARFVTRVVKMAVLVGAGYALWRLSESRRAGSRVVAQRPPFSASVEPSAPIHIPSQVVPPGGPETSPAGATWVEPLGEVCPASHPVKATLSNQTFYLPGDPTYERVVPDRCYVDADAASADGFRSVKP